MFPENKQKYRPAVVWKHTQTQDMSCLKTQSETQDRCYLKTHKLKCRTGVVWKYTNMYTGQVLFENRSTEIQYRCYVKMQKQEYGTDAVWKHINRNNAEVIFKVTQTKIQDRCQDNRPNATKRGKLKYLAILVVQQLVIMSDLTTYFGLRFFILYSSFFYRIKKKKNNNSMH